MIESTGLAKYVRHWARRDPDAPAVYEADDGERLTYSQLASRADMLSEELASAGIGRGSRVAAKLPNEARLFVVLTALHSIGASLSVIHYRSTEAEARYTVETIDADAVITPHGATLQITPRDRTAPHWGKREPHVLFFTGGTTGRSRSIVIPWSSFETHNAFNAPQFSMSADHTTLVGGTLAHGLPFAFSVGQILLGGKVTLMRRFDAARAIDLARAEERVWIPCVPTMLTELVGAAEDRPVTSVRTVLSGGSKLDGTHRECVRRAFPDATVLEYYGASEAGYFSISDPRHAGFDPDSVGMALLGTELSIRDADFRPLPDGEVGLIYRRGLLWANETLVDGRLEPYSEYVRDDWVSAGDRGRLDNGRLYIVGRDREMILSGGVNVFPAEVESVLSSHRHVREVVVVGVPDPRWGEAVTAFVVTHKDVEWDKLEVDLHELCAERLTNYKRPKRFVRKHELPRSNAGKLLRRVVVDDRLSAKAKMASAV